MRIAAMPRRARDRLSVRLHQQPRATPRDAHALAGVVWRRTGLFGPFHSIELPTHACTRARLATQSGAVGGGALARSRSSNSASNFPAPQPSPSRPAFSDCRIPTRFSSRIRSSSRMERPAACGPAPSPHPKLNHICREAMHLPGARTGRSLKERSRERAEAMDLSAAPNLVH